MTNGIVSDVMGWDVIAHGYRLVESPAVDGSSLLYSDVLGGGIYRWRDGAIDTVVPERRGVGGMALHADGGIVCSGRDVVHVAPAGNTTVVLHVDGVAGWNDLCTDRGGRVYAGALRFAVFDPNADEVPGELWCVSADAEPRVVFDNVVHANGVAFSPDESTIYMSDSRAQRLILVENGARRDIDVSAYGYPDGMAVDENGAVWLALVSGGIGRFTPDGKLDARIEVPSAFTTSVCFDGRTLYATTGGHSEQPELGGCVLRTEVDIPGAPVFPVRL